MPATEIRTADGAVAREGDTVWNYYDQKWGAIIEPPDDEGWFYVRHEDGTTKVLNGERIALADPAGSSPASPPATGA